MFEEVAEPNFAGASADEVVVESPMKGLVTSLLGKSNNQEAK
jgi:hypothetical protein